MLWVPKRTISISKKKGLIDTVLLCTHHMFWLRNKKLVQIGPRPEKSCLPGFAKNKGADQPVHPRSLISAFVIRLLESIISLDLLQAKFQFSSRSQ